MPPRVPPHEGLYDQPITIELDDALRALPTELPEIESLDASDAPRALARLVHERLEQTLKSFPSSSKPGHETAIDRQLALTNALLAHLEQLEHSGATAGHRLAPPARRLLSIRKPAEGLGAITSPARPTLPLSSSDLLVNGHRDISLGPEVQREIASANRVDLLCSFLKWSGFRLVEDALRRFTDRHPGALRILTTAYMSATDRRALDALTELGAQVRVSYDTTRTRLHAKAWLFHRDSGFSTATVGSSNLSAAAMLDGLEWNVRLSQIDNGPILEKFRTTFEQYWADPDQRLRSICTSGLTLRGPLRYLAPTSDTHQSQTSSCFATLNPNVTDLSNRSTMPPVFNPTTAPCAKGRQWVSEVPDA